MAELYPDLDWVRHVNELLNGDVVDGDEVVNVAVPKYLTQFRELVAATPARVQANYIVFRNIKTNFGYLTERALDIQLEYSKALTGKKKQSPRWEKCVKSVAGLDGTYFYYYEGSLSNAVGSMFVRRYFPEEAREIAINITDSLEKEFRVMLDELDWMDETTRAKAHEKAGLMTPHIAYPKELTDDDLINDFYRGLSFADKGYMDNVLALRRFIDQYYVREFRRPIDKKSWKTHGGAAIVNAFYSPEENSIQFPAGILGGVFFNADRPLYMNYASYGFVVGHEITHGFDDQGSQRDGEGEYRHTHTHTHTAEVGF